MMNKMSLPHSSAAAERLFSLKTNIKTKHRTRLQTETSNELIYNKALLHNASTWQPTPKLVKKMTDKKWPSSETTQDEEDLQF